MSGDDYGSKDLKFVNENIWNNSIAHKFYYHVKKHNFEVATAVNEFCKKNNIHLSITWLGYTPVCTGPNWYFIKT